MYLVHVTICLSQVLTSMLDLHIVAEQSTCLQVEACSSFTHKQQLACFLTARVTATLSSNACGHLPDCVSVHLVTFLSQVLALMLDLHSVVERSICAK